MKRILLLFCFFFALGTAVQAQNPSKVDVRNTEGSTETIYSDISFGNVSSNSSAASLDRGVAVPVGPSSAFDKLKAIYEAYAGTSETFAAFAARTAVSTANLTLWQDLKNNATLTSDEAALVDSMIDKITYHL